LKQPASSAKKNKRDIDALSNAADFSPTENKTRLDAALRGARIVGHKPMTPALKTDKREPRGKRPGK
jgi:hypothetical protein